MRITRRLEFDAGHRIPAHGHQCRHLHGHRYAIEATVSGAVVAEENAPDQGMVIDFGGLKTLLHDTVVAPWDHAFLAYGKDRAVLDFLATLPGHKTVTFTQPPTVEHLAHTAFGLLATALQAAHGERVRLERVRLCETPNCWADAGPG